VWNTTSNSNKKTLYFERNKPYFHCKEKQITRSNKEQAMGDRSSDSETEEPTISEDVVVTKYKMAGDMANRKFVVLFLHFKA
jgi:hypothetical protein